MEDGRSAFQQVLSLVQDGDVCVVVFEEEGCVIIARRDSGQDMQELVAKRITLVLFFWLLVLL